MRTKISALFTGILIGVAVLVFASPPQPVPQQGQAPQPVVRQPVRSPQPVQVQPQRRPVENRSIVPQTKQPVRSSQPVQVTPLRGIEGYPVRTRGVEGYPVRGASPSLTNSGSTGKAPGGSLTQPKTGVTTTGKLPVFAPSGPSNAPKTGVTTTSKPGVATSSKPVSPLSTTTTSFQRGVPLRAETATKPVDQKTGTTTKAISKPGVQVSAPTGPVTAQSLADKSKVTPVTQRTPTTTATLSADKSKASPVVKQTATAVANSATQDKIEKAILKYTNEARAKQGLAPLKISPTLETLADIHSNNQAYAGIMAHDSDKFPVGFQTAAERMKKVDFGSAYSTRENVLFNSAKPTTTDAGLDSYAKTLVTQWMNSPPHKANILSQDSKYLGIGIKDGYATEVFASAEGKLKPGAIPQTTPTKDVSKTPTTAVSSPTTTPITTIKTADTAVTTTKTSVLSADPSAIKVPKGNPTLMIDSTAGPKHVYADGTSVFWPVGQKDGPKYIVTGKTGQTYYYPDGSTKTFPVKSGTSSSAGSQNVSSMTATKPSKDTETKKLIGVDKQASSGAPKKTDILLFKEDPGANTSKQTPGISASKDTGLTLELKEALKQTGGKAIIEGTGKTVVDTLQGKSTNDLKNVLDSFTSNLDKKSAQQLAVERQFAEKKAKLAENRAKAEAEAKKAAGEKDTKTSPTSDSKTDKTGSEKQQSKTGGTGQLTDSEVAAIGQGVRGALEGAGLNLVNPSPKTANQPSSKTADTASKADPKTSKVVSQENKEKLTALEDRKKWLESRTFSPTTHDNVPELEAKRQQELTKINAQIKELKAPAGATAGEKTSTQPTSSKPTTASSGASISDALNVLTEGGKQQSIEMVQKAYKMMHDPAVAKEAAPYLASFDRNYDIFMNSMKASGAVTAAPKASNAGAISSLQGQVADIDKKLEGIKATFANPDTTQETKNSLFKQEAALLATREQTRAEIHKLKAEDQAGTPSKASGSSGTTSPTGTPGGGTGSAPSPTGPPSTSQTTARSSSTPPSSPAPYSSGASGPPEPPDFSGGEALIAANYELWARLPEGDPLRRVLEGENARLRNDIIRGTQEYKDELDNYENTPTAPTQEASDPSDPPAGEKSEDAFKVVRDLIEYGNEKKDEAAKVIEKIATNTGINQLTGGMSPQEALLQGVRDYVREGMTEKQKSEADKQEVRDRIAKEKAEKGEPSSQSQTPAPSKPDFSGLDDNKPATPPPSPKDTSGGFDGL